MAARSISTNSRGGPPPVERQRRAFPSSRWGSFPVGTGCNRRGAGAPAFQPRYAPGLLLALGVGERRRRFRRQAAPAGLFGVPV